MKSKLLFVFIVMIFGCDGSSSPSLKGEQEAHLEGAWRTKCLYDLYASSDSERVYSIETHEFNEGELNVTRNLYFDSSCSNLKERNRFIGTYELGELFEVNSELFARDIYERFEENLDDPDYPSFGWHAYFFIDNNKLYFGADKWEGGDKPHLDKDKVYYLVE